MAKIFITTGLVLVFIGLIIHLSGDKLSWFGNLYGDIKIVKSNFTIYSPITSIIILSVLLSVILNIVIKFFSK